MLQKIALISFILCCFACKNGKNLEIKKDYYPSGKLKRISKTINDKTIDTSFLFYENGNIETIEVYNLSGKLDGTARYYWENGKYLCSTHFVNDKAQGETTAYDSTGNLYYRKFFYNDKVMGDYYEYKNNKVSSYKFIDSDTSFVSVIDYDEKGGIINNNRGRNIYYTMDVKKLPHDSASYTFHILQSNPLRNSNKLILNCFDKNGKQIEHDSINSTGQHLVELKKVFSSNLKKMDLINLQYDSIIKKQYRSTFNIVFK